MTDASRFLTLLYTQPMLRSDAIVVLCGEDAEIRFKVGLELFRQGGAPLLVFSGGRHEPPIHVGAVELRKKALGAGIAPDRIIVEDKSKNTLEQGRRIRALARARKWQRITLVASTYHLPRAFLTTIRGTTRKSPHILPFAAPAPWSQCPEGMTETRLERFASETGKILEYGRRGHCATYEQGAEYLLRFEQ